MIIDSNGIMIDEITEQYSENMQYIDDYQLQQIMRKYTTMICQKKIHKTQIFKIM